MEYTTLANGNKIASIGFGTYLISKKDTIKTVVEAIKLGYRHIDTAQAYDNEEEIGYAVAKCIAEGVVKREDLFITSKISPHNKIGYLEAINAVEKSLDKMGLDYIDLYLIHWPNVAPGAMWKKLNAETWRGFEECYNKGLVKNIGVSNFTIHHLEELLKTAKIMPSVNQLHLSPIWQQKEVVNWCKERNIQCVAWSPLVRFENWAGNYLENQDYSKCEDWTKEIMDELSRKYHKSKAQISLRWCIQKGIIPLAKSIHKERMEENINIFDFEISKEDMEKLDSLNARPCNPDATPDSIYNSWSMGIALNKKKVLDKKKFYLFNVPVWKYKRINVELSKCYIFGFLPFLNVKTKNENKVKFYLFGFLPILKRIKKKDGVYKYYLFSKIPFFKTAQRIKTIQNNDFLPNYNKEEVIKKPKAPKWNPFEEILFNGYDNFADYMKEGRNNRLFKLYLKLRFLITRKVYIPILTFRITSNCSLKCKECCAFTPEFLLDFTATFESFKHDLDKILESVDKVQYLNLFGGEPTLNPDLAKMIRYANTKKQIKHVFFTTNGTNLISDEIKNAIKEKAGNFIYISDYRKNKSIKILKQDEIVKDLISSNIPYFHIEHDFRPRIAKNFKNKDDIETLKWKYYICPEKNARIVEDGRYWACTIARNLLATNQYANDKSLFIDLRTDKNLRKEFIDFFKRDYFNVCEVCDFSKSGYLRFPAIQNIDKNGD